MCLVGSTFSAAQSNTTPLQNAVMHAMAGRHGTAVVLDVATSRIIASYRADVAARRLALPGSSVKPFTLLALLQTGKINVQTSLLCHRPLTIARHNLSCSHPDTKQPLDPASALAYSCNSYFTTVALRLTPFELRDSLVADGFASATGLTQKEAAGVIELASNQSQLQLEAIGEWGVRVTPLELLRAYANLARLADKHDPKLDPLFAGLQQSASYGMGRAAQPDGEMKVAGKTGTSVANEGAWTHAWFAGYAPADKPEIAVVVFLEKGRGGSDAAVVAREIFTAYASDRAASVPKGSGR